MLKRGWQGLTGLTDMVSRPFGQPEKGVVALIEPTTDKLAMDSRSKLSHDPCVVKKPRNWMSCLGPVRIST